MLTWSSYLEQKPTWPAEGRHVLAQHDDEHVVVYQAFKPEIADEAARLGRFGPAFSRSRMSWIKPNFLWMMFRCGWATKPDQERVLAVKLRRAFFERVLASAVASSFDAARFATPEAWSHALKRSQVRLQWDPDHAPTGHPVERRAVQLGLRGDVLAEYATDAIVGLHDITPRVREQHAHASPPYTELVTPTERVFVPRDPEAAAAIGLSEPHPPAP